VSASAVTSDTIDIGASERVTLLCVAHDAVVHGLRYGEAPTVDLPRYPERLSVVQACFVSLHRLEELRGCVGSLEARLPLLQQVASSAYDAAFCDQRLSPVEAGELRELTIEISILSALSDVPAASESELLGLLRPGIDGVVLYEGERRATFLPKVWESIELPFDFLEHLRRKAGLPSRYWSPTLRIQRYTADCFGLAVADLDEAAAALGLTTTR
jgi:AmmeMemoRadiSam system protein A